MTSPYRRVAIAFATMHGKERAVERPLARVLGASVLVPSGINTDLFGTFTGDIPRAGTMIEAARSKALLAIARTELPFGLGSEGSFGPHPRLPLIAGSTELLLFVDGKSGLEISESLTTRRTNYGSAAGRDADELAWFLRLVGFPSHAVVVSPNEPRSGEHFVAKGVDATGRLKQALCAARDLSDDSLARVTTDMRAHLNPTRMGVIRALAFQLVRRLAANCPSCGLPGFGQQKWLTGLPCSSCGEPTPLPLGKQLICPHCAHAEEAERTRQSAGADPRHCLNCNP